MAKVLETVQRFRKVEEATAQKDEPAPVYILDELAELSKSSPENAQGIVEHVVKRLAHKSPVVKFKALRLVKHLCNKGCTQFQRYMQRHSQSIRELIHFKGDPDPFKGDAPNNHVREMAKETVEALFNTTVAAPAPAVTPMQGRIQGFGSNSVPTGPSSMTSISSSSMQGGRMVGFGNPRMEQQPTPASPTVTGMINNIMKGAAAAASSISRPQAQHSARMYDSPPRESASSNTASWQPPSFTPTTAAQVMGSEEQLVDDLCAPGGLRAAPPPEELQRFVDAVGNMDGLRIGELLRVKMESSSWQTVLRSLYALEGVVNYGSTQACGEVAIMFQSDPTPIRNAAKSTQQPVVEAAARVLKLLLDEEVQVQTSAPKKQVAKTYLNNTRQPQLQQQHQQQQSAVPDLLALDDSPKASSAPTASTASDLLGGLTTGPATQAPATSLLSGLTMDAPPPSASSTDMFGGLNVSSPSNASASSLQQPAAAIDLLGASPPVHPQSAVQQPAAARNEPLDLLFSGLTTSDTPAAQPSSYAPPAPQPDLLGGATFDLLGSSPTPAPLSNPQVQPAQQQYITPMHAAAAAAMSGVTPPMAGMGGGAGGLLGDGFGAPSMQTPQMAAPGYAPLGGGMSYGQAAGVGSIPAAGQQQPMPGYGMGYGAAPNMGVPGGAMPGGVNAAAAAAALQYQLAGAVRPGQAPMRQPSWKGNDELSSLMRNVATGGKHDPAFDFIQDELKPQR